MSENSRWQWKKMPDNYYESYYNDEDYNEGKTFVIIDTATGREYTYPIIEKRRNENGREYNQRIIDYALWNQEFMYWACSTSPDFALYLGEEWIDRKMLEILVSTPQNLSVFDFKLQKKLDRDLWQKAFNTNPEVYSRMPKQYRTREMTEKYVEIPNAWWSPIPTNFRTRELFMKLYNNLIPKDKVKLIKGNGYNVDYDVSYITKEIAEEVLGIDITVIERIPIGFISEEHSKKAIEVDGSYLKYVPVEYRSKELCEKAFNSNPADSIEHIPAQFHTVEMHKMVIDIKAININRIPDEVLSDEVIRYALSKSPAALGGIPEERRTEEICNYASSLSSTSFSHIPNKFKNYDICFRAVLSNPKLIKKVPVEILNQQFVDALRLANVIIPSNAVGYVKECLLVHERLQQEDLSIKSNSGKPEETLNKINSREGDFKKIHLAILPGLFTQSTLSFLLSHNIVTIEDLLTKGTAPDFIISLGKKNVANEILGSIRLIKCKYLDEDPLIDENSDLGIEFTCEKMGLSVRSMNCLWRRGLTTAEFFELMREPGTREGKLLKIRNMGENGVAEIINKTQIVIDYHDRHKKKESSSSSSDNNETLESLNEELLKLREEMQSLTTRIDAVLAKIQQNMIEQTKGGVLK